MIHTTHDPFPGVPDGVQVKVDVEVDTQAAIIVVDLTNNPDCQPCGVKSHRVDLHQRCDGGNL